MGGDDLTFSRHATKRMAERGITPDEVASALQDVEYRYVERGKPVKICRAPSDRRLKVVLAAEDDRYVVTVAGRDEED